MRPITAVLREAGIGHRFVKWVSACTCILSLASCDGTNDINDAGLFGARAFEKGLLEIRADPDQVVFDREITLTMETKPLVTGKGRYLFQLVPNGGVDSLNITSPVFAKLSEGLYDSLRISIEATFVAGEPSSKVVRFRIPRTTGNRTIHFGIEGRALIDSIQISGVDHLLWIDDSIVKSRLRPNYPGYDHVAVTLRTHSFHQ